jgi:hypothetical protein
MRTIKTEHYWLLTDSTAEIKGSGYRIDLTRNSLGVIDDDNYYNLRRNEFEKVIGHLPINNAPLLEGVPLLMGEPVEDYYKLSEKEFPYRKDGSFGQETDVRLQREGFIEGYKSAKQKGCFTLEQVYKAIYLAFKAQDKIKNTPLLIIGELDFEKEFNKRLDSGAKSLNEIIQSIQPVWEYEVEMNGEWIEGDHVTAKCAVPKTTITNGITYLVGKWKQINA